MKKILFAGALAMLAVTQAYAGDVKVTKAWTRATAPGQDTASIQLTITSQRDANLITVESGSAKSGEIHSMVMENGVMKMRAIDSLPLPAKTPVNLGEGGNHLMLIGLRKPLRVGRKLPFAVVVKFADGKTEVVRVLAAIKPLDTIGSEGSMQMKMQPDMQEHQHH
jgi:periplasmic copper chaperone A